MRVRINPEALGPVPAFLFGMTAIIGTLLILPALGAIFGAVIGLLVGILFGTPILKVLGELGVESVAMWEFGCFLGFVSGFFRASKRKESTNNF